MIKAKKKQKFMVQEIYNCLLLLLFMLQEMVITIAMQLFHIFLIYLFVCCEWTNIAITDVYYFDSCDWEGKEWEFLVAWGEIELILAHFWGV